MNEPGSFKTASQKALEEAAKSESRNSPRTGSTVPHDNDPSNVDHSLHPNPSSRALIRTSVTDGATPSQATSSNLREKDLLERPALEDVKEDDK